MTSLPPAPRNEPEDCARRTGSPSRYARRSIYRIVTPKGVTKTEGCQCPRVAVFGTLLDPSQGEGDRATLPKPSSHGFARPDHPLHGKQGPGHRHKEGDT
jgi:hypothetical protein